MIATCSAARTQSTCLASQKTSSPSLGKSQTIFYDDGTPDGVLVGAVPR